ncbi:MAG: hypothetical protein EB127_24555 [Alphaproteobacteria bacterium]|nr:hypothetical protein [Alphaproteobacteria bacterium]
MEHFKVGDKVRYTGSTEVQVRWGNNDNPVDVLFEGDTYYVERIEIHTWHTKLYLRGVYGKFNSVCFERA